MHDYREALVVVAGGEVGQPHRATCGGGTAARFLGRTDDRRVRRLVVLDPLGGGLGSALAGRHQLIPDQVTRGGGLAHRSQQLTNRRPVPGLGGLEQRQRPQEDLAQHNARVVGGCVGGGEPTEALQHRDRVGGQ
ncbi:hypothetical protein GCM10023321_73410 [Pseudonocardia eucalypti]|uniref:Uncharacterized protein n=1 Tax=Pseudonocardia eucalypti TaxID=648755 RepID=A0ABP9R7Z2_9PSEU